MDIMQRPSLLRYAHSRYFRLSGALMALAIASYALVEPANGEPYGGTWLGYVLGIVSLLIVLLLTWYGVAKRRVSRAPDRRQRAAQRNADAARTADRRNSGSARRESKYSWRLGGTMQGWLSAHVYLGISLLVLATLHTGFQFGWNIHTLSYALMLLVIGSGFYGIVAYLNYPRLITENMGAETLDAVLLDISELDELARVHALGLSDEVNAVVLKAREETRIGGSLREQLGSCPRNCPTARAAEQIHALGPKFLLPEQQKLMRDLYSVMLRKEKLVIRARNEIKYKARMQVWLYIHAPLTLAMLAALGIHVLSIYFYW